MTTLERQCLRRAARLVVVREEPVGVQAADDVHAFVAVFVAAATVADVANCIQTIESVMVSGAQKRKWMDRYAPARTPRHDADLRFPYRYSNTNTTYPR